MNKTGWPVYLTKFGFTPPSLVCPVYTSKPPCANLPHRVRQSIQNTVCCWEKNINHCYLPFLKKCAFRCAFWYVPSCFNLWNTCSCAALFAEVRSPGGFTHMLWASSSALAGVPAPSQGDPWHLRKGDKYLQWPTLSTGLKKGHRGPKREWKGYSAAHTMQEKALAAVQSCSEWVFQFNSKLKAASVV